MSSTIESVAARPLGDDVAIRVSGLFKRYHTVESGPTRNPALNDLILLLRQIVGLRSNGPAFEALRDLSFEVPKGTALGIIGGNGSGKSTLLKLISRVTPPSAGEIEVSGRVVSLLEMGFGFRDDQSGRHNVMLSGAGYGIPKSVMRERVDQIVEFAGLHKFIDMPLRSYSSGMYLRLAFATAIFMDPDIVLADEVLAVGDIRFRSRCIERLMEMKEAGTTILYVSHDLSEIRRVADRVLWVQDGAMAAYGDTEDVVESYLASMDHAPQALPVVVWEGTGSGAPPAVIERAVLSSSKAVQVERLEAHRSYYIQLRIRTRAPNLRIFPRIDVSSASEAVGRFAPMDVRLVPAPTTIDVTLRLPRYIFNAGRYTAKISLEVVHDDRRDVLVVDEPISFTVVTPHDSAQPYLLAERAAGAVHPLFLNARCDWEFAGKVDRPESEEEAAAPSTTQDPAEDRQLFQKVAGEG